MLLSQYVQIPSVTGQEKEAGEFLARYCQDRGLHLRVFTDEPDSYNFAASLYPLDEGRPNIVLLTHIDVVPAGDPEDWTYPPFSGTIAGGKVWGRGAIDNKAMGVMQVMSLLRFVDLAAEQDLPYNVSVLAVSGEETGGYTGAGIIVKHFLEELNPVVVYGEGGAGLTGIISHRPGIPVFGISVSQKRVLWIAIESEVASSGHGAVPRAQYPSREVAKAATALLEARPKISLSPTVKSALREIGRHERGVRRLVLRNIGFFGPVFGPTLRGDPLIAAMLANTLTLTSITSTPGAYNQLPAKARAVFDCRLLPETSDERFLAHVENIISPFDVSLQIIRNTPAAPVSETGPYYRALEEAVLTVYPVAMALPLMFVATNDNRFFRRQGIPAYGLLPAIMPEELIESIHSVDERFPVEFLEKGIETYTHLINLLLNK